MSNGVYINFNLCEYCVTTRFSLDLFYYLFMCVYIYTRMWLFAYVCILTGLVLEGYFGHFVGKGKIVILPYRLF